MSKNKTEETIIAHGVRVQGDVVSDGDIVIEGEVKGTVKTAGDLRVGKEAKIHADVVAKNATVAGEIRGTVQAGGRLELTETSNIIGDVAAEVLSISAGAQVNGKITMDGRAVLDIEVDEDKSVKD